jgi:hypothetical protein
MAIEDPFSTPSAESQRQRYASFNSQNTSLYATASPAQLKRALEAHLAETERKLREASQIGTILVKQRQDLSDRIKDVENQPNSDEVGPELRQKLVELEREAADISRETARLYVPKSRVASAETDPTDPSVFSSQAHHSPSKVQAPSRRLRNQPSSRLNDVKLATDISDALLNQLRELQAAYAEKDDALKVANTRKAEMEDELDALQQKLRGHDENQQRYEDQNWLLETQVHELTAAQKEAAEREQKLNHVLNAAKAEKSSMEREFDELKQVHSKLAEDHSTARKQHDSELSLLRRNAASNEDELSSLHKKVDDLTSQNKELAKAFAAKLREAENFQSRDFQGVDSEDDDLVTPEPSPPPSPSKATPRHGALESETVKSSLHHAQRMIQHLKNSIHREKTEKFELKRMLQEARDELDSKRKVVDAGKKKAPTQAIPPKKQARPDRLGAQRSSKDEIIHDDDEWEDQEMPDTPTKGPVALGVGTEHSTDAYVTATENSDAFETANEHDPSTETEAFQTGVESLDGNSDSEQTETEQSSRGGRPVRMASSNRLSFLSTASTSDGEDEEHQTPVQSAQPKFRLRLGRGGLRNSSPRVGEASLANSPSIHDSPASTASAVGTPQGRSLFAELGNLSDGETEENVTPQSMKVRSVSHSPEMVRRTPHSSLRTMRPINAGPATAEAATMTSPMQAPQPPRLERSAVMSVDTEPVASPKTESVELSVSSIFSQDSEPVAASLVRPLLVASAISSHSVEPCQPERAPSPVLSRSTVATHMDRPAVAATRSAPTLSYSGVTAKDTEPVVSDSSFAVEPPTLSISAMRFQETMPNEPATRSSKSIQTDAASSRPALGFLGSVFSRDRADKDDPFVVAEDPTDENLPVNPPTDRDVRIPFQPVDGNAQMVKPSLAKAAAASSPPPVNESTQTMLSAKDIDLLFKGNSSKDTVGVASGTVFGSSPRKPRDAVRRPGSAGSNRSGISPPPPLPAEAKQVIAAAAQRDSPKSVRAVQAPALGSMGPPTMPASAYNRGNQGRPRTPVRGSAAAPSKPVLVKKTAAAIVPRSSMSSAHTRQSSVSSFASELDARFNIGGPAPDGQSVRSTVTDPRMIQALTQTMIGEYMWKYTRQRTGGGGRGDGFSGSRHQRYFWVHPYTRTLYWSEQNPTAGGKGAMRAKSVAIDSVEVVDDDNPAPAGVYGRSILVHTPGRTLKLTAPNGLRHETWFSAMSYLLQHEDEDEDAQQAGQEYPRSSSRATGRSHVSVSSRVSRATARTASPNRQYPTLHASRSYVGTAAAGTSSAASVSSRRSQSVQPPQAASGSISSRLSAVFRTPQASMRGSVASRYSVQQQPQETVAEAGAQEERPRERSGVPMMENVRACCDGEFCLFVARGCKADKGVGKHDVGSLTGHTHSHGPGKRSSFTASLGGLSRSSRRFDDDATVGSRAAQQQGRQQILQMDPANIVS